MANKRKPRAPKPVVVETKEGVSVQYRDRVLPPALPPLRKRRHCPKCGHGPASAHQRYGTTATAYLYECARCVDQETCRPTRWQEPRV